MSEIISSKDIQPVVIQVASAGSAEQLRGRAVCNGR